MSGVKWMPVELAEVVRRANLVVVAEPAEPFDREVNVPLSAGGEHPPYLRHLSRYVVREVLHGDVALAGSTIEVDRSDWRLHFSLHERYVVDGVSKWVGCDSYESSLTPDQGRQVRERILFLNHQDHEYEEVVAGAREAVERRADIVALLGAAGS